jgi:mannose-6-phosphate isomerase-like protein (cupin superfamily)
MIPIDIDAVVANARDRVNKVWGKEFHIVTQNNHVAKIMEVYGGYTSSWHHHRLKDETFVCLAGSGVIECDGLKMIMRPGQSAYIPRSAWHKFYSHENVGMILLEVSNADMVEDNYRQDASRKMMGGELV